MFVSSARTHSCVPDRNGAAVAGVAVRIVFWAMTDRRFEDGLITVTHARNAANGLGLTHHPGEAPTHGFTSAISVLVPLLGELVQSGAGFFALRALSLLAFLVAIVCAAGIGRHLGIPQWLMIFPLGYLAFDQNQIFYGMAGMETQIATAVLLAGLYAIMRERVVVTGALLGLALLARPDFILWVVPALVYLFVRDRREGLAGSAANRGSRPHADGEYLDKVVEPGERVVSESAGYVGYYSHVTLYDFPGLTSRGALRALETLEPCPPQRARRLHGRRASRVAGHATGRMGDVRAKVPDVRSAVRARSRVHSPARGERPALRRRRVRKHRPQVPRFSVELAPPDLACKGEDARCYRSEN